MSVERWAWYSIALNIVLAALHAAVALASGSLAVTAELVHNAVDLLSAVAVLVGIKLATRKSRAFPYGLYKIENVVAAGLAILIMASAYEIAQEALLVPTPVVHADVWMLVVLVVTGALPLVFSHFELAVARAANSPALAADAREYRVHVLTTGLAFAALASQWLAVPIDRFAALIIVVAIAWTGWSLLREAIRVLLDASLDAKDLLMVRDIICADPGVRDVEWVTGRNAGRYRFVEAGVTFRVVEVDRAEAAMRRIEASVRAAAPYVERVLIHLEAPAPSSVRYAVPLADDTGTLSEHFGEAPFFALVSVRVDDGAIEEQRIVGNPHHHEAKAKGVHVAEWVAAQKADIVLLKRSPRGKGMEYVLRDAGIRTLHTDQARLIDALSQLGARRHSAAG